MDKLWKWVMHLNAKLFCVAAAFFFFCVVGWCGFQYLTPLEPLQDGTHGKLPPLTPAWSIGTLDFVSNQLAAEALVVPVDPFRPTIEAIFTNETERAAFLKALKSAQNAAVGLAANAAGSKKEDPFAHLRKKQTDPNALVGPNGQPMVIPKISFMGFIQRPDGKQVALFRDSAENTTAFYDAGKQVHGVEVLDANVREAKVRLPDGSVTTLALGKEVELAAEPAKMQPKKAAAVTPKAKGAAGAQAAAAAGKPGAEAKQKAAPQKVAQQKGAPQKGAAKKVPPQKAAQKKVQEQ